jgi:GDPmannose 4,6-dehydratase
VNKKTIVDILLGDPTRAAVKLNWKLKISYEQLVSEIIKSDYTDALKN